MIVKVFTVRDSKADAYMTPFYIQNSSMALRTIGNLLHQQDHQFALSTEDFSLWESDRDWETP